MRYISLPFSAVILSLAPILSAQDNPPLLNVKKLAPGIVVEMRYATVNNFTRKKLYPVADECLLCEPAAGRLARVQKTLEKKGLGLKVWDCYRPVSVQKKLWDIVSDPRYVADPKTGSRHNRGASVDLTLVDAKGRELPMPTAFDEFSEKAHRDYSDLPADVIKNRATLEQAMTSEGFIPLPTEWWHFDSPEWAQYALRDEPLGSASLSTDKKSAGVVAIPADASQAILVVSKHWNATTGTLQRYERAGGAWEKTGAPWPVSLGLKGMAWGSGGLATDGAGPKKKEGDNKAPAGIFRVGGAYGYAASAPSGSKWPYQQVDDSWRCVDDPNSSRYNQIFSSEGVKKDWVSAERMKRQDHLYKWVINVEQNTPSTCGCGSCIFLHVWRDPGAGTEGCTAMDEANMVELLRWLDPSKKPVIVQTPDGVIQTPL